MFDLTDLGNRLGDAYFDMQANHQYYVAVGRGRGRGSGDFLHDVGGIWSYGGGYDQYEGRGAAMRIQF